MIFQRSHHMRHHHGGPAPFGPWGRDMPFRRRRARRGDVRAALLVLLAEEPRNGYGLMQEIEQRSEGVWRPSPGSVYPALQQLEDEGLVRALRGLIAQVAAAGWQVGQAGTEAQTAEARRVLADTRRALYRILAED